MQRLLLALVTAACAMTAGANFDRQIPPAAQAASNPPPEAPLSLADVVGGKARIQDLTWPLNPQSAYWPGENYTPFELHTLATLETDGVLSKAFSMPEHLGTHIDAPNHFERGQRPVDQIPPGQLFAPGVVIDVSTQCGGDPDYRLSVADIERFEGQHGPIPTGAVVLAYTGWSRFWNSPARYQGQDVMGRLHFPGFSAEAARWLVDERKVRGIGLDTMSVDHGPSRDFPVHHVLGKAGRYGLENVAKLETLPPAGFFLVVAPLKIETGSGGPTRLFALMR